MFAYGIKKEFFQFYMILDRRNGEKKAPRSGT